MTPPPLAPSFPLPKHAFDKVRALTCISTTSHLLKTTSTITQQQSLPTSPVSQPPSILFIGGKELCSLRVSLPWSLNHPSEDFKSVKMSTTTNETNNMLGSIYALHYNSNNNIINIGRHDGSIQQLDIRSHSIIHTVKAHDSTVKCFSDRTCDDDNYTLLSGAYDGYVKMWDCRKFTQPISTSSKHSGYVNAIHCYENDKIITSSIDGICIFEMKHSKLAILNKFKQKSEVLTSYMSNTSSVYPNYLYFACKDGSVRVFDMNCFQVVYTMSESNNISVNCMDCNGVSLFACNNQGLVYEYSVEGMYEIAKHGTSTNTTKTSSMDSSIRSVCCFQKSHLFVGTQGGQVKCIQVASF
ncbi:hypothetical protein C9374_004571 [Naegleria lovaniensis]|uniref:Guanine nucleotide-binding protein subunit beta-like protein n=1 Tax=Naegleria lovaniensis TaxID=51637 RepID=A0AA88GLM7_NAELO|nr:uncharacterized protein C9374_004571 [Naegleria lovaniensis]KAG2383234.1 hypothetical protein C9374_004571 [Naegleria lovaniensis]